MLGFEPFEYTRVSSFTGTGNFIGDYVGVYSRGFQGDYTGDYTRNFEGNYSRDFTGNYSRNFIGNYTGTTIDTNTSIIETYTLYLRTA
jgi:hypothetical protein